MPITTKKISDYAALIISLVSIITAVFAVDAYYAKAADVKKIEMRLEHKILSDRYDTLQQRGWRYEDRGVDKLTPMEKEEFRKLQDEKKDIEKQIDIILKTQKDKK